MVAGDNQRERCIKKGMEMDIFASIALIVGTVLGGLVGYLYGLKKSGSNGNIQNEDKLRNQCIQLDAKLTNTQVRLEETKAENTVHVNTLSRLQTIQGSFEQLEREYKNIRIKNAELETKISDIDRREATLIAEKSVLQRLMASYSDELIKVQDKIKLEFESTANRIFEDKATKHEQQSTSQLNHLLAPLQSKLVEFQRDINDKFSKQMSDTNSLTLQIESLKKAEIALSSEAKSLTMALKGNVKAQGNWGELVLEKVLESSGLENGKQFIREGVGLNLVTHIDDNTKRQRPDVIVLLPENKCIVVDSKVSIAAYERFIAADSEEAKKIARKEYISNLRNHIGGLASKKYHNINGYQSPEFVLMFLPTEGAFSFALESDAGLFEEAWQQNINIVSPTNLLATLRTVASVWRIVRQEQHAAKIAEQGGILYDQFVLFAEELAKVGRAIKSSETAFENANKRLTAGKGANNIVKQAARLKELGAKATSSLPEEVLQEAEKAESALPLTKQA